MNDLVERLRLLVETAKSDPSFIGQALTPFGVLVSDAADEIERLRRVCDQYEQFGPWRAQGHSMTPDPPTSTVHTAAVLAVLAAVRNETHAENHLSRLNTKALTARNVDTIGIGKDIRTATRRLAEARTVRRDALRELDELEYRQATSRKPGP